MINYIVGDATKPPTGTGNKIIIHCCNDIGAFGAGFALALANAWPQAKKSYQEWFHQQEPKSERISCVTGPFALGEVQFVWVSPNIYVGNIIGQHGLRSRHNEIPIRYEAIRSGLKKVAEWCKLHHAVVVGPRLGSGLSGGSWSQVAEIIEEELVSKEIGVTIYDFEK